MNRFIFHRATFYIAAGIITGSYATVQAQLPNPGMDINASSTALVVTDPQIDFLSPEGVTWGVVGVSVTANNTVNNIATLFAAAKESGYSVFYITSLLLPDRSRLEI